MRNQKEPTMRPPTDKHDGQPQGSKTPSAKSCEPARARQHSHTHRPLDESTTGLLSNAITQLVFDEASRRLDEQYSKFSHQTVEIDAICADLSEMGAFDTDAEVNRIQAMRLTRREVVFLFEKIAIALGEKWVDDEADFLDVTIGMARLQAVLRGYVEAQIVEPPRAHETCDVLIATMPGEEHTFAATLLELNMRLLGWNTTLFSAKTHKDFARKVEADCYDVVCLSWSTDALTDSLANLKTTIEAFDIEKRPVLIAGGAAAEREGKWLVRVGVDYICDTAIGAVDVVHEALSAKHQSGSFGVSQRQRTVANSGLA